jgi:hypothetical protein
MITAPARYHGRAGTNHQHDEDVCRHKWLHGRPVIF